METNATPYRRLTRLQGAWVSRHQLWLADDHVLYVREEFFHQTYKRFFFQDLQAIVLRKTDLGRTLNGICGILALILIVPSSLFAMNSGIGAGPIAGWAGGGAFLLVFLFNLLAGPTCVCHFQTAVQTEEVQALRRLPYARRIIGRLKPLIEGVQGTASAETVAAGTITAPEPERPAAVRAPPLLRPAPRHEDGRIHEGLFIFMLLDTVHTTLSTLDRNPVFNWLSGFMLVGYLILMIWALIRQHHSDLSGTVKGITWGTLAYFCTIYVWSLVYVLVFSVQHPEIAFQDARPLDFPGHLIMNAAIGAGSLLLGLFGLRRLYQCRREQAQRTATGAAPP